MLPYSQEALYSLIANIEAYPTFLSVCTGAKILERTPEFLRAELVVGYGPFKEKFISKVYLAPFDSIEALSETGPFRHLRVVWNFQALSLQETSVDFFLDIEFKSKILERMVVKMIPRVNLSFLKKIFENPVPS
jgi:coenzyme Q-binding protein COQ10